MIDEYAMAIGATKTMSNLEDGTVKLYVYFSDEEEAEKAWKLFGKRDSPVIVSLMTPEKATLEAQNPMIMKERGDYASSLIKHGFFYVKEVLECLGTDKEFLEWTREQKCAICGSIPPNEAAHVRRIANGAGTGIKPPYSTIPLCHHCHERQHQHGESSLFQKEFINRFGCKRPSLAETESLEDYYQKSSEFDYWCQEKMESIRAKYLVEWGRIKLKQILGVKSFLDVPRETIEDWANNNGVAKYLPR